MLKQTSIKDKKLRFRQTEDLLKFKSFCLLHSHSIDKCWLFYRYKETCNDNNMLIEDERPH